MNAHRQKMVNLLVSHSEVERVLTEDQKKKYAELIVEVFELKLRDLL